MKLNKLLKLTIGTLFAIPTIFLGNEILANHHFDNTLYEMHNDTHLLACGGGGGGGGGNKPGALKAKKLTSKLNFKKRQLSKAAAAGKDTSALKAEIMELEAAIAEAE